MPRPAFTGAREHEPGRRRDRRDAGDRARSRAEVSTDERVDVLLREPRRVASGMVPLRLVFLDEPINLFGGRREASTRV